MVRRVNIWVENNNKNDDFEILDLNKFRNNLIII